MRPLTRRVFLADLGKTVVATGFLGAACSASGDVRLSLPPAAGAPWIAVDLGSVYAYVVFHEGEATIIDTGAAGSADDIEAVLTAPDIVGWDDVGHVVLTHSHPDHAGSIATVLERATAATGYIGTGDLDAVTSSRPLTAVGDGDTIMGLDVIDTPGHTPGHICLLDRGLSVLFAGDALRGANGAVAGPNPRFTADLAAATGSIARLASLSFDTVVFGHGDPVVTDAAAQVAALIATE